MWSKAEAEVIELSRYRGRVKSANSPNSGQRSHKLHADDCPYCKLLTRYHDMQLSSHILIAASKEGEKVVAWSELQFIDLVTLRAGLLDAVAKVEKLAKDYDIDFNL